MNSFQNSLLQNTIAAFVTFILGLALGWMSQRILAMRAARQLLGFPSGNVHIVLAAPSYLLPDDRTAATNPGSTNARAPLAAIGTFYAFRHMIDLMARTNFRNTWRPSLYFSADFPASLLGDNLILIGFSKTNLVTRDVTKRLNLPVAIDDHSWHDSATGDVYRAIIEEGRIAEDYGALVRAPNPYNNKSVVYIVAGTQTYGVKAAAEFLNSKNLLAIAGSRIPRGVYSRVPHSLHPLLAGGGTNRYYEIIVGTHVRQYFTSDAWKVASYPL